MNTVNLIGRLTATPELKQTNSGLSVCNFTLAVKRPANKDETDFIPCVCWKGAAEYICRYGEKGRLIGVTGCLNSRKWTDADGKNHTYIEVNCRSVEVLQFVDKPKDIETEGSYSAADMMLVDDEDTPF